MRRFISWLKLWGKTAIQGESGMGTAVKWLILVVLTIFALFAGTGHDLRIAFTLDLFQPGYWYHEYGPFSLGRVLTATIWVIWLLFAGGQAWTRSGSPALEIEDSLYPDTDYSMFRLKITNRGPGI